MKTTDYRMTEGMGKKGTFLLLVCAFAIWSTLHANKDVSNWTEIGSEWEKLHHQTSSPLLNAQWMTFGFWLCICVQHALFITVTLVCLCDFGWGEWRQPGHVTKVKSPSVCVFLSLCHLSEHFTLRVAYMSVCVCEHKHVIAGPPRLCLSERLRTTTLRRWRERKTDKDRETHRGALKVTEDKTDKWRREREAQWRQGGGGEERHAGEKATLPPCKINLQNLNWTHISQWK